MPCWSFRSKRFKSPTDNLASPPYLHNTRAHIRNDNNGSNKFNYGSTGSGVKPNPELGASNDSACSSSSGSATPSSLTGLPITSPLVAQHLHVMRDQMAAALTKLREYEELVPELRKEIADLKHHNRIREEKQKLEPAKRSSPNQVDLQTSIALRSPLLSPMSSGSLSSLNPSVPVSPQNNISFVQSINNRSKSKMVNSAPVPPQRKYKSVGTGDNVPIDEIICYRKSRSTSNGCENDSLQKSIDYKNISNEIVNELRNDVHNKSANLYAGEHATTNIKKNIYYSLQDSKIKSNDASTQTNQLVTKNTGSDAKKVETRDNFCNPDPPVEVELPIKSTDDKVTSTLDLVLSRHKNVGTEIKTADRSTFTKQPSFVSRLTSCDGLIRFEEVKCGPDRTSTYVNAGTCTVTVRTRNIAVGQDESFPLSKTTYDKLTMTSATEGRWVSYSNLCDVACGTEQLSSFSVSTNTPRVTVQHKGVETSSPLLAHKGMQADIRSPTSSVATLTTPVLKYNQATDCTDIKPVLRHNATNTIKIKTTSVTTQYVKNKSNLVNSMVNTTAIEQRDASTSTPDISSKTIDAYVDQVKNLLEEQQTLLAENYEVFKEENISTKTEKVSRFVNPAFQTNNSILEDSPPNADPISVSLSLIEEEQDEESSSSESSEYDSDSSDYFMTATLRPLPSPECEASLKSIMKKPGAPKGAKKCLRFAEGVKSDDDSSSSCSSSDESSENDEEEENNSETPYTLKVEIIVDKSENNEEKTEEVTTENNKIESKQSILPKKGILVVNSQETNRQFNYSNEFVKKTSNAQKHTEKNEVTPEPDNEKMFSNLQVVEILEPTIIEESNHIPEHTAKYIFTSQVLDACDALEKHLRNPKHIDKSELSSAKSIVQQEWFRVAAQTDSSKRFLDDFVRDLADTSLSVLRKVVNMTDTSGNTVLHYAISHGNISVVDSLLSIDELDVNKTNQAGYTSAMLASLCDVSSDFERTVYKKLFIKSDVNAHAKEAGQTCLMLAVSHGRLSTAQLLLNCGADINARDEDGSTALMCAVEHGQLEAVKILLARPNCDATIADNDGSTALTIAMEADRRDIAILLYAQLNFRSNANKAPKPRTACKSMISSPIQKPVKS